MALPHGARRFELVAGELQVVRPAGVRRGLAGARLGVLLRAHVLRHGLGAVFLADTGFHLTSEPDTVLAPDVSFVRAERLPAGGVPLGWFPGAPDLAVELLAPWDRTLAVEDQATAYLEAGGGAVWVVNAKHRRVTVHAPGATPCVLGVADWLEGGDVVPGFACLVREIFE
jgi:Uma2 family endonuclease